jgi:hypothetical protein
MELVGVVLESLRRDREVEALESGEAILARDRVDGLIIRIEPTHGTGRRRADDGRVRALFGHSDQEPEICHHRLSDNRLYRWSVTRSDGIQIQARSQRSDSQAREPGHGDVIRLQSFLRVP